MRKRNKILLAALATVATCAALVAGLLLNARLTYGRLVVADLDRIEPTNVAVVFGAGLTADGRPSDMLHDRLSVAARLYETGKVGSVLVSGDNRFENYSEPDVMRRALVDEFGVPEEDVHSDHAGRRTYDTCVRAHDLWGVRRAVLVTQEYHLPRALMTCSALGIESQGASASLRPYRNMSRYLNRESMATLKAYVDLYLWTPDYVGGAVEANIDG